jgi:dTDP-D-glucose 4,6-dehydratase
MRYATDAGKMERKLGWKKECDFTAALRRTFTRYVENPGWWRPR